MRKNLAAVFQSLFSNFRTGSLTFIIGIPTLLVVYFLIKFIFFDANWRIITENLRLFYLGTYPQGEEWRVWVPVFLLSSVIGLSYGISAANIRKFLLIASIAIVFFLVLGFGFIPEELNAFSVGLAIPFGNGWLNTLAMLAISILSVFIGRLWLRQFYRMNNSIIFLGVLWLIPVLLALILQVNISPNRWNGLFLDVMVFWVGALLSLPLGILLAVGRTSKFEVIRYSATAYIEIVRAGPLIVWLILALFLWNDLFFTTNKVHRGMLVFGFFGAAYIAEVIRGGLQSIQKGQYEAAASLGLNPFSVYFYVIIPQAIRAVIPALVGRFIALWKDTSLLLGLTLINTLEVATAILEGKPSNGEFLLEIYLIIALFYWFVSFVLSRIGRNLEKTLKVS